MSFYTISAGFLSYNPKVWIEGDQIYARTNMALQVFSLFSYCRQVIVDRQEKEIEINTRWLWGLKESTRIPFHRIDYIDTSFKSFGTEWGWGHRTDQFETYTILLSLKNPRQTCPLIKFRGEGSVHTGWKGMLLYGDSLLDFSGNQEKAFQEYFQLLKNFTGAPLLPSYSEEFQKKHVFVCEDCGKKAWRDQKCMYCGGRVIRQNNEDNQ